MSLISKRAGAAALRRALQLPPPHSGRLERYSPEWRDSDLYRLLSEVMGEAERQILAVTAAVVAYGEREM